MSGSISATPPPAYSTSADTLDIRATRSRNRRARSNAPVCVPFIASSSWRYCSARSGSARRDQLGELEELDLGVFLAALRDEDVLEALVRFDVLLVEREHAAQVIDGLLMQAVLHVDIGLGEDLRDLLGVTFTGGRRTTRIRRRLHVGGEIGVVVLGQREVDARQALLVDERHRAGHAARRPADGRVTAGPS